MKMSNNMQRLKISKVCKDSSLEERTLIKEHKEEHISEIPSGSKSPQENSKGLRKESCSLT
jgi:hypothetical protein